MKQQSILKKEQIINTWVTPIILVSAWTGFASWTGSLDFQQWASLLHVLSSSILSVVLVVYTYWHIRRLFGYRSLYLALSGVSVLAAIFILMSTGLHIIFFGRSESLSWPIDLHIGSACAFVLVLLCHIFFHLIDRKERKNSKYKKFLSFERNRAITAASWVFLSLLGVAAASVYSSLASKPFTNTAGVDNYSYDYGEHPFRPSETETYHKQFIDKNEIAISDDCADCHRDIAREWKSSIHKQAASDVSYKRNIDALVALKGISSARYCEGCHSPVALLTGQLSEGGQHGGVEGTPANEEGVGCLACHGISRIVHTRGVGSYEFGEPSKYLFTGYNGVIAKNIRHFLIKTDPSLHRREMSKAPIASPQLCATCHTQFMDKSFNNWGWIKMQDEYGDWLESHYSQQSEQIFSESKQLTCQDCHMPLVELNDPSSDPSGRVKSHRFPGANTAIPFLRNDKEQLDITREFLRRGKIRVSIETPNRKDATQDLSAIAEGARAFDESPYYYYLGEKASVAIVVTNQGVGHNFPGGTIDINEAWLSFSVKDASGSVIFNSGFIDAEDHVDQNAHFYRSRPIDRKGNLVWKHDLFNRVGELDRNVIAAGKSELVNFSFDIPYWAKSPLTLVASMNYRKFNTRYAKWVLQDDYRALPITEMARDSLIIPLRLKRALSGEAH